MFHDISFSESTLIATFAAAILYGMNVIVSGACARTLLSRLEGSKSRRDWILLAIAFIQFALATLHIATLLQQLIAGFIRTTTAAEITAYFTNQATVMHAAQEAAYFLNNLIADGVLIWRLYVVWSHNLWVVLPFVVMACGHAVCGFGMLAYSLRLLNPKLFFELALQGRWLIAMWSLSIATQLLATALIAWKIWGTMNDMAAAIRRSVYWSVIWIIVESGAILSAGTIFVLALFTTHRVAGAVVGGIIGQLGCLVPSSIVFRVSLNRATEPTAVAQAVSTHQVSLPLSQSRDKDLGHESKPSLSQAESATVGRGTTNDDFVGSFELKSPTDSDMASTRDSQVV